MGLIVPMMIMLADTAPVTDQFRKPVHYNSHQSISFVNLPHKDVGDSGLFVKVKNEEDYVSYDEIRTQALNNCVFNNSPDEQIIDLIISIEQQYELPNELKGMTLAAACHESGFKNTAKGDRKFSKYNKPLAVGLYQMWPWWENKKRGYGIDRTDVVQSTIAYLSHVEKNFIKVKRKCKIKNQQKAWLAGWATAIRAPKKTGRCNERPKFYRILKKWHRNIKNDRNRAYEDRLSGC